MSVENVEKMLERKVIATIPNNYRLVQAAAIEGGFVATDSELGRAYSQLAAILLHQDVALANPGAFSKAKKGLRSWFG